MVLLEILINNNLKYIRKLLGLRSLVQLCKGPLDCPNIIYIITQINKKGFDELDFPLSAIILTQSAMQKTMIFVDIIGEDIAIAKYFRRQLPLALQSKTKQIVRIFYADLDPDKKIKILENFVNREIKY